ncbi:SART-1 protein [Mucor lusitanicus]|uniref:SART-1 protein n=1 Tax=Mucor circinelloides f. lusitanicus TaxID=29924 RepID=A0A8H4BTT3_MUCCL|nr:SART-1 protein [Mucor lusitanicus]
MAESISIEETNALREKLGLPPLAIEGDAEDQVVDPDKDAYENYQKIKQEKERLAKEEEIRKNIEKSKNRKRNYAKLQGKGLGEASDDDEAGDSALNWIKKSRKREKDLAARRARELEELDDSYQSYDAAHLAGLKVSHALSEFEEGGETILTLKDRNILGEDDDDADELSNVNLEDRERLKKKLEAKKQKPGYNPYDDDQFNGKKSSILPQYEEDEEESGFVIGKSGTVKRVVEEADEKTVAQKLKEQTLSYEKMQEIKDYYTQEEADATFKKPKSKKKKKMRRKNKDEDDLNISTTTSTAAAATEEPVSQPRSRTIDPDANFVDDDDLQESLARARRIANKQKNKLFKKMTPEEIAKQIREEQNDQMKEEDNDEGGLVLSEATEFVNALGNNIPTFQTRESAPKPQQQQHAHHEVEVKVEPDAEYEVHTVDDTPSKDVKMEEVEDQDTVMAEPEKEEEHIKEEVKAEVIVEEPLVSRGLAATLNLLNQKGIIAKPTEEQIKRDKITAEQIRWQNEQRKKERLRELEEKREKERRRGHDRRSGKDGNSDRQRELEREREREREREEAQRMREYELAMQNYKPEVNLEYTDDTGRVMKTAEAFRYMSHKFHGKTSGKTKTEKRMQKIEEERKLNMMSSTDTPHNLAGALLERQQRTGNAHVVLSVGNRGVVPSSTPLAKSSKSNKK